MAQKNNKRPENLRQTLRVFLSYLGRHKRMLFVVAVLVSVSATANLLGTYMIRPVVNNLADGKVSTLIAGVAIAAVIFGIGALSAWGYSQTMVKVAQRVIYDIRHDLFAHVQKLPLKFFDTRKNGDIMSLFTNDIDTISDALNNSFAMVIQTFIQMVGTLLILYILNWKLSLIVTACYIEEMISGQKVIKVFNHEQKSFEEFCAKNEELRKAGTGAQGYAATMVPMVVSISYINYAIVAVLGGLLALNGHTDLGSLASYLVFVRQAALPINQFTQQSNFLLAALAGAERVFKVMDMEPEIDEGKTDLIRVKKENGVLVPCKEKTGLWAWQKNDGTLVELKGDVRFDHVDFGYDDDRMILKQISLYAKPGQKIAFVGSTGAGKTTITNLINRFYDVQGGSVIYDGIDVRDIKKDALRRSLGIVLQDTHLFTGTVAENIRFGKLDATQEEIEKAAKIANADSFIRRLPHGYDTLVTVDGANLSQGQRQLLAIARAAVADPPVLILDEATSSVDTRTEALIERGMDQLMEGRTVFVIAHRLSTVRNSNAIMVLEQGKIVERGDHDDLLEKKGKYYQLYHGMLELS